LGIRGYFIGQFLVPGGAAIAPLSPLLARVFGGTVFQTGGRAEMRSRAASAKWKAWAAELERNPGAELHLED